MSGKIHIQFWQFSFPWNSSIGLACIYVRPKVRADHRDWSHSRSINTCLNKRGITVDNEYMLLSDRGWDNALANIGPWNVLVFLIWFAINVLAPSAEVVRLLNWFADWRFCRGFMNVWVASVVIGQSSVYWGCCLLYSSGFL